MNANFVIGLFLFISTSLFADTHTWDGGGTDNNWTTAENWVTDVAPVSGDDIVFAGTSRLSPVNDFASATSFNSVVFSLGAGDFNISGNSITLAGGASALSSSTTTGSLTINLDLVFTTAGSSTVTVESGGELIISGDINTTGGNTLICHTNGDMTVSGVISGTGDLNKRGAGTLTLSGANTFTGDVNFDQQDARFDGIIRVENNSALGVGPKDVNMLGFNNVSNRIELVGGVTLTGININTRGRSASGNLASFLYNTSGNNTVNGSVTITNTGGSYFMHSIADTLTFDGGITNNAGSSREIRFTGSGHGIVKGVIEDGASALGIRKDWLGTWILTGENTYTGTTNITGGTLQIGQNGTTGSIASTSVTNSSILKFHRSDDVSYNGVISGTGALIKDGVGTLTLGSSNTYTGTTTVEGGFINFNTTNALGNTNVTLNDAGLSTGSTTGYAADLGVLTISGSDTIALGSGNHTLTFDDSSGETWGTLLTVTGWSDVSKYDGTAAGASHPKLFIGSNASGLTASQLNKIGFLNPSDGNTYEATILSTGEVVPNLNLLPVELKDFRASLNYEKIELSWETASEVNSKYFTLKYSADGVNFTEIAHIDAAGQSSTPINYNFTHQNITENNYYKLLQIDLDGTEHHKGIKYVRKKSKKNNVKVYPNPSSDIYQIKSSTEIKTCELFDTNGRLIQRWVVNKNNFTIENPLPPGIYYAIIKTSTLASTFKLFKK